MVYVSGVLPVRTSVTPGGSKYFGMRFLMNAYMPYFAASLTLAVTRVCVAYKRCFSLVINSPRESERVGVAALPSAVSSPLVCSARGCPHEG